MNVTAWGHFLVIFSSNRPFQRKTRSCSVKIPTSIIRKYLATLSLQRRKRRVVCVTVAMKSPLGVPLDLQVPRVERQRLADVQVPVFPVVCPRVFFIFVRDPGGFQVFMEFAVLVDQEIVGPTVDPQRRDAAVVDPL